MPTFLFFNVNGYWKTFWSSADSGMLPTLHSTLSVSVHSCGHILWALSHWSSQGECMNAYLHKLHNVFFRYTGIEYVYTRYFYRQLFLGDSFRYIGLPKSQSTKKWALDTEAERSRAKISSRVSWLPSTVAGYTLYTRQRENVPNCKLTRRPANLIPNNSCPFVLVCACVCVCGSDVWPTASDVFLPAACTVASFRLFAVNCSHNKPLPGIAIASRWYTRDYKYQPLNL